jgi:hypothetical protein
MKCLNHLEKDAVAVCVSCGVGLCADCRKVVRGANYCDECEKTHQPMHIRPGAEPGLNVWAVIAWILAVVGWWPRFEFLMFSVAGFFLGLVAIADISLRSQGQAGKGYAYAAVICAALGMLLKLSMLAYLLKYGLGMSPWLDPFQYFGSGNGAQ